MTYWRISLAVALLTVVLSCGQPPRAGFVVTGVALAGPVCPVESNPPDPACAPRPVVAAVVLAVDDAGEVSESMTGADGRFAFVLTPGRYQIVAQPTQGLMGTPAPIDVEVTSGAFDVGVLMYDTGIR